MRSALKTILFEKRASGGQMINAGEIENWPGIEKINGPELSANFFRHADSYGLETKSEEIVAVKPGSDLNSVYLADGTILQAYAVILGTGGKPKKLNISGEDEYYGKGVSYCAVCDGFFFKNKTVVVAGGGDTAAEESLYLAKLAKQVYLAHRRDTLRAGMILQKRVKEEKKIKILWNTVLTGIKADLFAGVNQVDMKDTQTGEEQSLPVDGVFVFIGFEPENKLVPEGMKLSKNGYVITDEKCETSIPGIYAIGDLRKKYARQIITAAADGATAALAAAQYVERKK